jgi:transcriptional regulator with XRE-family HTH domain
MVFVYWMIMTVGARLRAARMKLKKRQHEIAAELGCTQPAVSDWESDKALPRTQEIRAVAKAYGLKPELLLPDETAA